MSRVRGRNLSTRCLHSSNPVMRAQKARLGCYQLRYTWQDLNFLRMLPPVERQSSLLARNNKPTTETPCCLWHSLSKMSPMLVQSQITLSPLQNPQTAPASFQQIPASLSFFCALTITSRVWLPNPKQQRVVQLRAVRSRPRGGR